MRDELSLLGTLLRRLAQLTVRHTSERNCWVALPPALLNRLYETGVPLPFTLALRPAGPGTYLFLASCIECATRLSILNFKGLRITRNLEGMLLSVTLSQSFDDDVRHNELPYGSNFPFRSIVGS